MLSTVTYYLIMFKTLICISDTFYRETFLYYSLFLYFSDIRNRNQMTCLAIHLRVLDFRLRMVIFPVARILSSGTSYPYMNSDKRAL